MPDQQRDRHTVESPPDIDDVRAEIGRTYNEATCPSCGPAQGLRWVDDQWYCPLCGDEFDDAVISG